MKTAQIGLSSKALVADLERNFRITPRKSLTLQPPRIYSIEQKRAFVLGYIDGDGSVGVWGKKKIPTVKVLGTREVLEWIADYADEVVPFARKSTRPFHKGKKYKGNQYAMTFKGNRAVALAHELNSAVCRGLSRKWSKLLVLDPTLDRRKRQRA